jgi:Fe-Mn family superoxide dismutase
MTAYTPKDYKHLIGLPGFSDTLLLNHFTLYEGYVKNVNVIAERSKTIEPGTPESAELRRRFGWEWNGMRLHEVYFDNLTKESAEPDASSRSMQAIAERFGSMEAWEEDFRIAGAMRGIGWVMLVRDGERLFNVWINEHDAGHLAGCTPLLVMDVFEHAYATDYGIKRAEYIEVFFRSIDWKAVERRFL